MPRCTFCFPFLKIMSIIKIPPTTNLNQQLINLITTRQYDTFNKLVYGLSAKGITKILPATSTVILNFLATDFLNNPNNKFTTPLLNSLSIYTTKLSSLLTAENVEQALMTLSNKLAVIHSGDYRAIDIITDNMNVQARADLSHNVRSEIINSTVSNILYGQSVFGSSLINAATAALRDFMEKFGATTHFSSLDQPLSQLANGIERTNSGDYRAIDAITDNMNATAKANLSQNTRYDVVNAIAKDVVEFQSVFGYEVPLENATAALRDFMEKFGATTTLAAILPGIEILGTARAAYALDAIFDNTSNSLLSTIPASTRAILESHNVYYDISGEFMDTTNSDDFIYVLSEIGNVRANDGNDVLFVKNGNIQVDALMGDGNDIVYSSNGNDRISGDNGNDVLYGGGGSDYLQASKFGLADLNATYNKLYGEDGNDFLYAGSAADLLDGGNGIDRVHYSFSLSAVTVDLRNGTGQGGDANGDTYVSIEDVYGSSHHDTIYGNNQENALFGNTGDDLIFGGDGDDSLRGDGGNDTLYGGKGNDTIRASRPGVGQDDDNTTNFLYGESGDDSLISASGRDILDGGVGIDTVTYADGPFGVGIIVNLETGIGQGGFAEGDTYVNIENVTATYGNDVITGNSLDNRIFGIGGRDILYGRAGNDSLVGGYDSSFLYGEDGDDYLLEGTFSSNNQLYGGAGDDFLASNNNSTNDLMDGGTGFDFISYWSSTNMETSIHERVIVDLRSGLGSGGAAEGDHYISIEGVDGSLGNDIIYGNDVSNVIYGSLGQDALYGGAGDDYLIGDPTIGFSEQDILTGGTGSDNFIFHLPGVADIITDFSISEYDVLDLSNLFFGIDLLNNAITDFITQTSNGSDTMLFVNRSGANPNPDNPFELVIVENYTSIDILSLYNNGQIIV